MSVVSTMLHFAKRVIEGSKGYIEKSVFEFCWGAARLMLVDRPLICIFKVKPMKFSHGKLRRICSSNASSWWQNTLCHPWCFNFTSRVFFLFAFFFVFFSFRHLSRLLIKLELVGSLFLLCKITEDNTYNILICLTKKHFV